MRSVAAGRSVSRLPITLWPGMKGLAWEIEKLGFDVTIRPHAAA